MKSNVYFIDLRATPKENLINKLGRLVGQAGLGGTFKARDLVAVKIHFGEMGNTAYIRPVFIRKIVQEIKNTGGVPFITDANTLYAGTRSDSPNHLITATQNGFAFSVVEAPLVIADGLRGKSEQSVSIGQKRFDSVYIGSEILEADALVSVAHFKGHELSGFGGTIKNVGMGCASRRGKLAQHSTVSPQVSVEECIGCEDCIDHCSQAALSMIKRKETSEDSGEEALKAGEQNMRAVINPKKCIGCGECILICPNSAIQIKWDQAIPVFLENMVEYTMGVLKDKKDKSLFLNFITDVSPACDCYPSNDAPIVRNVGILASRDPVAIDQASVDLVNAETALPDSCLKTNRGPGEDKFGGIYPEVDWRIQLDYAQELGLGSRSYELKKI